ncbi:MAG: serine/threonine protein kinase [Planctomycetaceae bacterium]|nr:serine/threonine protein kinase [Planctomycetaceae bacterium]
MLPVNPSDSHDELLASLLAQLEAGARNGQQPDVESLINRHPELAAELRALWATASVLDGLNLGEELESVATSDTSSPARRDLPRRMGDYELINELGRGGMGVVYRARQLSLGRTVAVKMILRGELASPTEIGRFRAEAEAAARLDHPHIVSIFEVGTHDGQPYFSMQYVPGTTLAQRIHGGPLPAAEAASLLIPVCRAVAAAHRAGVLHRDLKPSNVLIDDSGRPYVTDFGLAKQLPAKEDGATALGGSLTHSGAILGTPGYMAPEQAAGQRGSIGPSTDVYSLGAVLYAMLTGRPPFQAASPVDTLLLVLEQDPPLPRILNPQADPDLELIALKALQKPSDLRYATADALADDLEAFLRHEPISARSSQFSQVLSRAFRPTHHAPILENWGLLWIWHALVLFALCLITNAMQLQGVGVRWPYVALWTAGLGAWAGIFWSLRRRAGPVTFVERQIAHVWAASMVCSTMLFAVEKLLGLPVLTLSPVLPLLAAAVFLVKAGILSGEFYVHAAVLLFTAIPMALMQRAGFEYGITLFGLVASGTFLLPGIKFHRQRQARGG